MSAVLNTEFWIAQVQEQLFADNEFFNYAVDHSQYVTGKFVNVPNAGQTLSVTKDRSNYPASALQRTDANLAYQMHQYDIDPFFVTNLEEAEFNYNKKKSVMDQMMKVIKDSVAKDAIYNWATGLLTASVVQTSGAIKVASSGGGTGNRLKLAYADLVHADSILNGQNIPMTGRKIVLTPGLYADVLNFVTGYYSNPIVTSAINNGSVGSLLGCDVYIRQAENWTTQATGATVVVSQATGTTNNEFGLMYHPETVAKAMGTKNNEGIQVFIHENDPLFYSTVFSALTRFGASRLRSDNAGVIVIAQTAA